LQPILIKSFLCIYEVVILTKKFKVWTLTLNASYEEKPVHCYLGRTITKILNALQNITIDQTVSQLPY